MLLDSSMLSRLRCSASDIYRISVFEYMICFHARRGDYDVHAVLLCSFADSRCSYLGSLLSATLARNALNNPSRSDFEYRSNQTSLTFETFLWYCTFV